MTTNEPDENQATAQAAEQRQSEVFTSPRNDRRKDTKSRLDDDQHGTSQARANDDIDFEEDYHTSDITENEDFRADDLGTKSYEHVDIKSARSRDGELLSSGRTGSRADASILALDSNSQSTHNSRKRINPYTDDVDPRLLCDPEFWADDSNFVDLTAEEMDAFEKPLVEDMKQVSREAACIRQSRSEVDRSHRNPDMDKSEDLADQIDKALTQDGHKKWGWVLYRCTYESEDEWQEVLSAVHYHLRKSLKFYNALDLLDSHEMTVIEDRIALDGADSIQLRQHFEDWTASAVAREQGATKAVGVSQRYRFFLRMNKESVDSIINVLRSGDGKYADVDYSRPLGHMDLILAKHTPETLTEEPDPDDVELSDGGRKYRVGWARFNYKRYLEFYTMFRPDWCWMETYIRPPELIAH